VRRAARSSTVGPYLDRQVAAELLEIEPEAVPAGLHVERFCDVPGQRLGHPNRQPWGHVSLRGLAEELQRATEAYKAQIYAVSCVRCGTNRRFVDRGYTTLHPDFARCPSCAEHFDTLTYRHVPADWERDLATSVLCGTMLSEGTYGLGRKVGVRWYSELSDDDKGALPELRPPFAWHQRDIRRWCAELGLPVPTQVVW
jgi:hypothetical protein